MMKPLLYRTPTLTGTDTELKRSEIRGYFHQTQDRYESLFKTLRSDEAYYKKPISLRHPLIFYYGHTATFFINKLTLAGLIKERINPLFESMFAVGVDEMSWDDLDTKNYHWPKVSEVYQYRVQMRNIVDQLIQTLPMELPITWETPWWPIIMGIEHEQIHLETSSVLIRQHDIKYVQSHEDWPPCLSSGPAQENKLLFVSDGVIELNKTRANHFHYGWDNEYGFHSSHVASFKTSQFLVSNKEFLFFVEDRGYQRDELWQEEGLAWRNFTQAQHPTFWKKNNSQWQFRTMTEEIPMPWNWPVEVNYHEAKAFCQWKKLNSGLNVRLPTEDEWYRLYDFSKLNSDNNNPEVSANLHLNHYASSMPVDTFSHGDFYDVIGNVWQWTETPIYPFEGFDVHPLYDDFTTPTFDTKHNLIKGGSWISCGNETLRSSRYAFRRHFFQHAGFRYIVSDNDSPKITSHYEADKLLSEYAEFHYGDTYFNVPNFPKALADLAISVMENRPSGKALDLGCASGRATFELARHFDQVIGVDFSARFIGQGVKLAQEGVLRYSLTEEGELVTYRERSLNNLNLDFVKNKVSFYQGDACNLKDSFSDFDFILAANLIDRLYDPAKFLNSIHTRLNKKGLLMIASPYTWMEEHTKKDFWIGGYKRDGESFTTFDGLKEILGKNFNLIKEPISVPFVIRETKRKFQHTISEVTVWEKK